MKIASAFAASNAVLAVACALLGAAPFTPAPMLLFVLLPLAALFARLNQSIASLIVVAATVGAGFLTPLRLSQLPPAFLAIASGWLVLWAAAVIYFSRRKLGALMTAVRGGGAHGA
jgi:hypothetical protein